MIEIRNVTKSYLTNAGRHFVFRNLSFTFNGDRNIALLGANGAGKSTLIRMLGGVETPDTGSITTGGKRLSWPVNFASTAQATLSGRDTVKFVCRILGIEGRRRDEKLSFVNDFAALGKAFDKAVKTYSSGMRSRLVFAMTMAFDFDYYLIDEVTAVGDTAFKEKSRAILREKMKYANILLVSHNMKMVREFCDEVVLLSDGVLAAYGNLEEGIRAYQGPGYRPPKSRNASSNSRSEKVPYGTALREAVGGGSEVAPPPAFRSPEQTAFPSEEVREHAAEGESTTPKPRVERRRAKRTARAKSATTAHLQRGEATEPVVAPASGRAVQSLGQPGGLSRRRGMDRRDRDPGSATGEGDAAGARRREGRGGVRRKPAQVSASSAQQGGTKCNGSDLPSVVTTADGPIDDASGTTAKEKRRRPQTRTARHEEGPQELPRDPDAERGRNARGAERQFRGDVRRQTSGSESRALARVSAREVGGAAQPEGASGTAPGATLRNRSPRRRPEASEAKAGSPATFLDAGSLLAATRRSRSGKAREAGTKDATNRFAGRQASDLAGLVEVPQGPASKPARRRGASRGRAEGAGDASKEGSARLGGARQARDAKPGAVRHGERAEKPRPISKSENAAAVKREHVVARKRLREKRAADDAERLQFAAASEAAGLPEERDLHPKSDIDGSRSPRTRKNPKVKGLRTGNGRQP